MNDQDCIHLILCFFNPLKLLMILLSTKTIHLMCIIQKFHTHKSPLVSLLMTRNIENNISAIPTQVSSSTNHVYQKIFLVTIQLMRTIKKIMTILLISILVIQLHCILLKDILLNLIHHKLQIFIMLMQEQMTIFYLMSKVINQ